MLLLQLMTGSDDLFLQEQKGLAAHFYIQVTGLTLIRAVHLCLTISLKAFSMAPTTRLSCWIFFSVKKRGGGGVLLGEPGVPVAPRSEEARVSAR